MPRRITKVNSLWERLNALITLQLTAAAAWLLVVLLTYANQPLFLALQEQISAQAGGMTFGELFLSLVIAITLIIFLWKKHLLAPFASILLSFLGFTGAVMYLGAELAFFLAATLLLFERMRHTFLSNNLLILFAVVFGAIPIGISYQPELLIFALFLFSIYDVLGVFFTRVIPHLARASVKMNIPLLLIAPRATHAWQSTPTTKNTASILGAGDVFLPAFLLSSVTLFVSVPAALAVFLGALVGAAANTVLATFIRTGIPAMPLMTIGMIIAYYVG